MKLIKEVVILLFGILLVLNHPIRAQGAVTDQTDRQVSFEIKEDVKEEPKDKPKEIPKNQSHKKENEKNESNNLPNISGSKKIPEKRNGVLPKTGEQLLSYKLLGLLLIVLSIVGGNAMRKKGCHE